MSVQVTELECLRRENEELRRRVTELERRLGERAFATDEERRGEYLVPYRQIFDKLPIAAVVTDASGFTRAANRLFCEQFGVTPDAARKYNIYKDPKAVEMGYPASIERALRGEVVRMPPTAYDTAQSGIERLDDRQIWTQITYIPLEYQDGTPCVVGFNVDVTEQQLANRKAREHEQVFQALLDHSPLAIYAKDREGRYIFANCKVGEILGIPCNQLEGRRDHDLFPSEMADKYAHLEQEVLATEKPLEFEESLLWEGRLVSTFTVKFPLFDEQGSAYGVCSISLDVTERRQAEEENRKLQEEIIHVQKVALRALSTPLIPIARGVIAMPLIGDIDQSRARQVLETLLRGVAESRARIAILDVTGVTNAGPEVVEGLIQSARAVGLLGARVVLTGVQPQMAQLIASLSEGLGGIVPLGTLESGIAYAMRALRG